MAAASNKLCKASVKSVDNSGTIDVYFRSNVNMYTGDFGDATGIAAAPPNEQSNPAIPIRNLIRAGLLVRMVAVTKATATDPSRQIRILATNLKDVTVRAWPDGAKTIPGISGTGIIAIRNVIPY